MCVCVCVCVCVCEREREREREREKFLNGHSTFRNINSFIMFILVKSHRCVVYGNALTLGGHLRRHKLIGTQNSR